MNELKKIDKEKTIIRPIKNLSDACIAARPSFLCDILRKFTTLKVKAGKNIFPSLTNLRMKILSRGYLFCGKVC
jgi:hypothetical protein